ncbi:ABC transporter ATP-binding protein [Microbacterium halophytorum]|uniref:ABC transporter ATP-binding protein n=1 Tax=Microbacterium halophytorum TaxID=2067568 RepID=UPI001573438A|nr:ABC transporter ATP-binding protein [Microbacterium halophytorum]
MTPNPRDETSTPSGAGKPTGEALPQRPNGRSSELAIDTRENPVVSPPEAEPEDEPQAAVAASDESAPEPAEPPAFAGEAPALRLSRITKSYGSTDAVTEIDLTVPRGAFYGLVGPNGAGKTTLLSMIAGLLTPTAGTLEVCGVDMRHEPRRAKKLMGVLPDRLRTFDRLSGRQLLYYMGVLRGLGPGVITERIDDLARVLDLTDALSRVVSDYSAGMTKKVMLAAAMIHSPSLLVLDEPFEAVDPVSSETILGILSDYVAAGGTVVLSSHGMDLVEKVCSRVAVIVSGQVLAEGTVDDVKGASTLEERFVELSGAAGDVGGLEWLRASSN